MSWMKYTVVAVLIAGGITIFARTSQKAGDQSPSRAVDVTVPELSLLATRGQELFNDNCAACHGDNGKGTDMGPPLIHAIYKPSHHADMSFSLAVANGVRQHHWPYGNMPAQPHISQNDLQKIIRFVRETQQANGIVN
ncbi:cytochrome c [Cohaesibacter sp. CAU 1516]|uniref:c-type cytochrome n=1 Tax=Cohaesibacter sp. CAU 1516 TaxID=2576038 RepID=UPI0010FE5515|nr:cytochrome c [Cohaesibacter sp. CAU 1516]TLP42295.1 cytochrome c [Cohaesibacter sp. CAU 1516]